MKRFTVLLWLLGLSTTLSAQGPVSPQGIAPHLKDKWSEVGEFSQDGKNWMKFFEMTLQRVK